MHAIVTMRPLALVIVLVMGINAAEAASISKVDSKDGKTRINLDGEIVAGDADKLREIIKVANDAGRIVATIRLNSEVVPLSGTVWRLS